MVIVIILVVVLLPVLLAGAYLLGRQVRQRHRFGEPLSLVTRQHLDLFQGGQLNESLVEAAKVRFRDMLERGEFAAVEASLRPGVQYVVQVRALAELGTDDAGRILERQLQRRLSEDQLEQSWYWIDLANGLRSLNRQESLPHLLRCAESASEVPLGHFFAAETVCFLGFIGYLREQDTPLGGAALRILHCALEGLRHGIQPHLVAEARLGEVIETLWDHRPDGVHPLLVRIFHETLRLVRRAPQLMPLIPTEGGEREAFEWQISRLIALEAVLAEYIEEAPQDLRKLLPYAQGDKLREILLALLDVRAEAARELLPLLAKGQTVHVDLSVELLTWSKDPLVGPFLRHWLYRSGLLARRPRTSRRSFIFARPISYLGMPYKPILKALRGHPSEETEKVLLLACRDGEPTCRAAAIGSLGWWEPLLRQEIRYQLNQARRDTQPEVRQAARAALARLGERQALHWFRQALTSENPNHVHEAIQVIATEGLTLLWPDLDRLVDSENSEVVYHAREALERLFEEMEQGK
jgi:hypothetical protein